MTISLDSFTGCGFPEEYLVWIMEILFFIVVCSFVLLHIIMDEEFIRSRTWLPITFYIFHRDAYSGLGRNIRLLFLLALLLLLLLMCAIPFLYQVGILQCGNIVSTGSGLY